MPLVVMVGIPTSGKTSIAYKLQEYFQKELKTEVITINEEYLNMDKQQYYSSP